VKSNGRTTTPINSTTITSFRSSAASRRCSLNVGAGTGRARKRPVKSSTMLWKQERRTSGWYNIANWSQSAKLLAKLRKDGTATIGDVTVRLMTPRDAIVSSWDGPILVLFGEQRMLDLVDSLSGTASVLCILSGKESASWIKTWGATRLGTPPVQSIEPTSGVPFAALRRLTESVNLNNSNAPDTVVAGARKS
jgi:hypothetical protein